MPQKKETVPMENGMNKRGALRPGTILVVDEESNAGGTSYCWVERRKSGYYLLGNELGKMSGPCITVEEALIVSGFQFGMDYMFIKTTLSTAELKCIMAGPSFILSNVSHLVINGIKVDPRTFISSRD
jgi:hypothetical protein